MEHELFVGIDGDQKSQPKHECQCYELFTNYNKVFDEYRIKQEEILTSTVKRYNKTLDKCDALLVQNQLLQEKYNDMAKRYDTLLDQTQKLLNSKQVSNEEMDDHDYTFELFQQQRKINWEKLSKNEEFNTLTKEI